MRNFRDLIAWQKALDLADGVYDATEVFPAREQFSLSQQLRKSALSVPSNIAEGAGRLSSGEWLQFLGHARGSLYEAQTQLIMAERRHFGDREVVVALIDRCDEVARIINGLMRSSQKFETKKFGQLIRDSEDKNVTGVLDELEASAFAPATVNP
jgi:four helix bundle protein